MIIFAGYGPNTTHTNVCYPECASACPENSVCTAPDHCSCLRGYEKENNTCKAVCSEGCGEGICLEPEKCGCKDGKKQ